MAYIDTAGFHLDGLETIRQFLDLQSRNRMGQDIDLAEESPLGQQNSIIALLMSFFEEYIAYMANGHNPDTVQGQQADDLFSMLQIVRKPGESTFDYVQRYYQSIAYLKIGVLDGMEGALRALDGITHVKAEDNDEDSNATVSGVTIPAHAVQVSVYPAPTAASELEEAVFEILRLKKPAGIPMQGDRSKTLRGQTVKYQAVTEVALQVAIAVTPLANFPSDGIDILQGAIFGHVRDLNIAENTNVNNLYGVVYGAVEDATHAYTITSLTASRKDSSPAAPTLDEKLVIDVADITATVN